MSAGIQLAAPVLQVSDVERARRFYGDTLGLPVVAADGDEVILKAGSASEVILNPVPNVIATGRTAASFTVADLPTTMRDLRSRGVSFKDYDEPGLRTVDGIHDDGECLTAWTEDPDGNIICICSEK